MPNGSYTDGQTKAVAAERISRISCTGRISRTQNTPLRSCGQVRDGGGHLGGDLRGVGSPGAQHQLNLRIEAVGRGDEVRHTLSGG